MAANIDRAVHQSVQRVEGIRVKLVIVIWHMFEHFRKLCIAVYCFHSFEMLYFFLQNYINEISMILTRYEAA